MELNKNEGFKKYMSVLADGKIHQTVDEGTEGSIVRKYEDKDEVEQTVHELVFDDVSGKITKISFNDGKFGKNILIEIDSEGVLQLSTSSNFGEDFMKKVKAIDLSKEVKIAPYSFEANGKNKKGITIYQEGSKVDSFYFDSEEKKVINGMPEPEGDTKKFDSDDWKMHFMKVRKFLISEVEALITDKGFGF